ncbi:MAG: FAD-dependent monooxygenase, partial [Leeuwenhoekiella sp.]
MNHTICPDCKGRGQKRLRPHKKIRVRYQNALEHFEKNGGSVKAPVRPKGHLATCVTCGGSGLVASATPPLPDIENYPHVAIIGGGVGGTALAVACLHRGIPFTLYERDSDFDVRSQGYGLTLQQARKAMKGFGIDSLAEGIISTRHVVHTTAGKVIGEWGMRKWLEEHKKTAAKRSNVHIARQSLRLALLRKLGSNDAVQWNHKLLDFQENADETVSLNFEVGGKIETATADLVVGADGIRSEVRKLILGEAQTPLHYLDCIVILGICPLSAINGIESELLDSATVFQTANGTERIYMMPYDAESIMWQLSFHMPEEEAKALSAYGAKALKEEAYKRTPWHHPIPQIVAATQTEQVSGYPVYDRELLKP